MEHHCGKKSKRLNRKHNKAMSDFCPQGLCHSSFQFNLWFIVD